MIATKTYKCLLIATLTLGLTNCPEAKASQLTPGQRFLISAAVGAAHGLVNKACVKNLAEPFDRCALYIFTYVLAHAFQKNILGKKVYNENTALYTHNDFMSLFGHGLAQSLVETHDAETQTIDLASLSLNWTLLESFFVA